jgi:signal peptidase I
MNYFKRIVTWYRRPKSKTSDTIESLIIIIPLAFLIRTFVFGLYQVPTGSMETTMLVGERFFADKFTILFVPPTHGQVISFNDPTFSYSNNAIQRLWQMYAWGPSNWTKRVIGIPGDHIQGTIEDGKPVIYRNGQKLDEPYLNQNSLIATFDYDRSRQLIYKSYVSTIELDKQPFYLMTRAEVVNGKRVATRLNRTPIRYPFTPCEDVSTFGTGQDHQFDIFDVQLGADEYWAMGDNRQGSWDSRAWGKLKKELIHGKIVLCLYSIDIDESWGALEWLHIFVFDMLRHPIDFWSRVRWGRCMHLIH